eukprot:11188743-Lingulodinium_polyedra.AAC.1
MPRQAHEPRPVPTEATVSLAGTLGRSPVSAFCACKRVKVMPGSPGFRSCFGRTRTEFGASNAVNTRPDRRTLFQKP